MVVWAMTKCMARKVTTSWPAVMVMTWPVAEPATIICSETKATIPFPAMRAMTCSTEVMAMTCFRVVLGTTR
ncbi:hypothetical protein D3C72_2088300 [compost metagenome]